MPMRLGTEMPSIEGATEWFNSEDMPQVEPGKVTLIHFRAVSCHICHETMPKLMEIKSKYEKDGLQVIAVHMPRYDADVDVEKVKGDREEYHMDQPIGLDHRKALATRFQNEYVPAFFIFDKEGKLKFRAAGDRGFQKVEPKVREALGLPNE
jgi:thiol-disulfide isomerase/thioredoxin